jgi:hypothetical protein
LDFQDPFWAAESGATVRRGGQLGVRGPTWRAAGDCAAVVECFQASDHTEIKTTSISNSVTIQPRDKHQNGCEPPRGREAPISVRDFLKGREARLLIHFSDKGSNDRRFLLQMQDLWHLWHLQ